MKNKIYNLHRFNCKIIDFFTHFIPIIIGIMVLLPFIYAFITSIQHIYSLYGNPALWASGIFTYETYITVLVNTGMLRWMLNSIIVSSVTALIGIIIYSSAGYVFFINKNNKLISLLFSFILLSIMLPKAVTIIPLFIMAQKFHLTNTYFGLILPPLAVPVGVFMFRQALFSYPMELIDASKIDGCSDTQAFYRVVLPVLKPGLVVVGIYTFMEQWRDFLWPLIITQSQNMKTIPVGISAFSSEMYRQDYGIFMASVIIAILPGIIAFLLFQRQFVKGLTAGALKG